MPEYDPATYWAARPNPNRSATAPRSMLAYVRRHLGNERRVLELGPGVGRTFEVYQAGTEVVTVDITDRYAEALSRQADRVGINLQQHVVARPGAPLPFNDRAFPVGVCAQVLLHIPPAHIAGTIRELARVCERCIVITGADTQWAETASHCFAHDYLRICGSMQCALDDFYENNNALFFVLRKRD